MSLWMTNPASAPGATRFPLLDERPSNTSTASTIHAYGTTTTRSALLPGVTRTTSGSRTYSPAGIGVRKRTSVGEEMETVLALDWPVLMTTCA